MNEENFIMVSLEDSKSEEISKVLGSKTCKKIISYLSENKEASQKDLSEKLDIPLNTLDYNIKHLLSAGFIQKRKNFFWSKKGKKIVMYELSNKSIVISPKKSSGEKLKSILPAIILTATATFAIWTYEKIFSINNSTGEEMKRILTDAGTNEMIAESAPTASIFLAQNPIPLWSWFLAGALFVLVIFSILKWRKL